MSLRSRKRSSYRYFLPYRTRWSDNDQYGHLNNSVYYHLIDSVVNTYLITRCGLEPTLSLSTSSSSASTSHPPISHPASSSSPTASPSPTARYPAPAPAPAHHFPPTPPRSSSPPPPPPPPHRTFPPLLSTPSPATPSPTASHPSHAHSHSTQHTHTNAIGLVISSHCSFFAPLAFPAVLHLGLRVNRVGRSSAVYEVGVFDEAAVAPAAVGGFVHVFVNRFSRRPVDAIDAAVRAGLEEILVEEEEGVGERERGRVGERRVERSVVGEEVGRKGVKGTKL